MSDLVEHDVIDDGVMDTIGPRVGGPTRRRAFSPVQKIELLALYGEAVARREGGAFLRAEGLYSSQMSEWRRQRDGGLLEASEGKVPVGKPTADQTQIARLTRQLEVSEAKLKTSEAALEIMGKLSAFFEDAIKDTSQAGSAKKS